MTFSELPIENIELADMPFYFRCKNTGNAYIRCGEVHRGGNEPYCYTEEKQCAGHVCRVICPDKTIDHCTVIRDDGTVWQIWLSNFKTVTRLKIRGDV